MDKSFFEKNKLVIIGAVIVAIVIVVAMVMGGGSGTSSASGNAKIDTSKNIKSNVGDVGNDNVQLEGISVGGNFSLDKSQKTNTLSDDSKK